MSKNTPRKITSVILETTGDYFRISYFAKRNKYDGKYDVYQKRRNGPLDLIGHTLIEKTGLSLNDARKEIERLESNELKYAFQEYCISNFNKMPREELLKENFSKKVERKIKKSRHHWSKSQPK